MVSLFVKSRLVSSVHKILEFLLCYILNYYLSRCEVGQVILLSLSTKMVCCAADHKIVGNLLIKEKFVFEFPSEETLFED